MGRHILCRTLTRLPCFELQPGIIALHKEPKHLQSRWVAENAASLAPMRQSAAAEPTSVPWPVPTLQ